MIQRQRRILQRLTAWLYVLFAAALCLSASKPGAYAMTPQFSSDGVWTSAQAPVRAGTILELGIHRHHTILLQHPALAAVLAKAPMESALGRDVEPAVILLPMPDGKFARFAFVASAIMAPELAAAYPELRTYLGWGLTDPHARVRFDLTPAGLHAQILSPSGAVYIDPAGPGDAITHVSYYKRDFRRVLDDFGCHISGEAPDFGIDVPTSRAGGQLRTYRLAVAATREYTQFHGGTVLAGLGAIVTAINRVNGIFETELGIRLELVANNNLLVYTAEPDPYTNGNSLSMIAENQSNLDLVIGDGSYDLGHVFGTGGGGRAILGCVCSAGQKAQAATGIASPIGDPYYVDYVAHEFGHQFAAQHTFNSVSAFCGATDQRVANSAYEPGSGSTIMAYPGICGADNLQAHADPYFHHESFRQISNFINFGLGASCGASVSTGNADPVVNAGPNYIIPRLTPFTLVGSASDPDLDPLTYSWEERDLGVAAAVSDPDNGSSPLFRFWPPTAEPVRTLPRLAELLNNTAPFGEQLPNSNRILNFRLSARDNVAGGGGVAHDDMQVTIDVSAGPFTITAPNAGAEVWSDSGLVTWNVAGTNTGAISATLVDIMLSTNGGLTFPIVLAASTPNDGSEAVSFTVQSTNQARVKVAAVGNIFFDLSNANFTIDAPALRIELPDGPPASVAPGIPTPFAVEITPIEETVVPGGALLHYRFDGGAYATTELTSLGNNHYEAVIPRAVCDDVPEFYVTAEGDAGTTVTEPLDAPTSAFIATVGVTTVIFADDYESDLGWTVTNAAIDGFWERGVPVNEGRGDPPADYDGSGQCYVTENTATYPASDVDAGSTTLTSPVIDLSGGGVIHYAVWLNDYPPVGAGGVMGPEDGVDVEFATNPAGTNWQNIRAFKNGVAAWRPDTIVVGTETPTSATFRLRFIAKDLTPGDVVEAGVDAISISAFTCPTVGDGDFDVDGDVDLLDFAALQACWTHVALTPECSPGDLNGDEILDVIDLSVFGVILSGP